MTLTPKAMRVTVKVIENGVDVLVGAYAFLHQQALQKTRIPQLWSCLLRVPKVNISDKRA